MQTYKVLSLEKAAFRGGNMKSIFKLLIGSLMIATALIGYIPEPELFVEFSCISNLAGGLLLIIDGILNLKGKAAPNVLYLNVCSGILLVFLVSMLSLTGAFKINLKGAFFFLHAINPIFFILCYIFFCNDKIQNIWKRLAVTPVFLLAYLLFDYILGNCRGYFVYGFSTPEQLSIGIAVITGIITYLIMSLFGFCIFSLNKLVHK